MNQKIILSLNQEELENFRVLVKNSDLDLLNDLVQLVVLKDDPEKYIKRKVFEALSDLSGFNINVINESQKLKFDLGLTNYHKKSLKIYFQRIVKDLNSTKIISVTECEKLEKVSDCLKLVKSKL
ncbi:hypothetical protein C7447_102553 [Tenacibaculum adriaticum]|uniref:Uncharacterized protein n=1 Tax=Tenacibaculum adriaticum TaxID=413713 RepID=A0A5S5DTL5_9FLAO|nr:hypothetical protein [Tenacibaculum adriaticum]TYP99231.1 hypothetical protein C7447_102553 [Tenacibaculum adriaticum]